MNITIGAKIKFLRIKKAMTQEKLAERLNVSAQTVSKWERGLTSPDISMLPVLTRILEVSADYLLGIENSVKDEQRASFLEAFDLWQKGHKSEDMYWLAREATATYPCDDVFVYWLASTEFWLAFEENLKPAPDGEYFNTLMENALRRYSHLTDTCSDTALRNTGVLGKITVLRFWERIDEGDWSAEFEYPDADIHTADEALMLWSQGREVLSYLETESNM